MPGKTIHIWLAIVGLLFVLALGWSGGHQNISAAEEQEASIPPAVSAGTMSGHVSWLTSVAFSADGGKVLTGSDDNTAKLWDVATSQELCTFQGHSGRSLPSPLPRRYSGR